MNRKEREFVENLNELGDRIRVRFVTESGKGITELMVQLECLNEDNKHIPIVRYDNAHGFFHKDIYCDGEQVDKRVIEGINDLSQGLIFAKQDIESNYENYKFNYNNCKK